VADWPTISALATAGGTLALAAATYASVRSANRSNRVAELALQEQRRPVLVDSRKDDRAQEIGFDNGPRLHVPGGGAVIEAADGVFLAASLRNVGAGMAVLQAWHAHADVARGKERPDIEEFRNLTRDQYIASGDIGLWQGAVRDSADPLHAILSAACAERHSFSLDLLYTDQVGGQRTISRFGVLPGDGGWIFVAARHWYLDTAAPR
jgi:hypothetical protein